MTLPFSMAPIFLGDIEHMISHSLEVREDFGKYDPALRLAFSFFQPLHLFLEIFVRMLSVFCLHGHPP